MGCKRFVLGIEGGGTKTTWSLLDALGTEVASGTCGPGNVSLLDDTGVRSLFTEIRSHCPEPVQAVGAGMAGAMNLVQFSRVERILGDVFPEAQTICGREDSHSGFYAAHPEGTGILLIAGTGSNCLGAVGGEGWCKAGGWGHLAGDTGSGWDVSVRGARSAFAHYDRAGTVSRLGRELLTATCCDTMDHLAMHLTAIAGDKTAVAALAPAVFRAAASRCSLARACVSAAAESLAGLVCTVAKRLHMTRPRVALHGSLLEKCAPYKKAVSAHIRRQIPDAILFINSTPGAIGAARLVQGIPFEHERRRAVTLDHSLAESLTEQGWTGGKNLAGMSVSSLVNLFLAKEAEVSEALWAARSPMRQAAQLVSSKLGAEGRLIYVGAGTSGRLGVLDASEIPPTFGSEPGQVEGVIAGGSRAVFSSVENAEDDPAAGAQAILHRNIGSDDVVVGISASGRTPYVLGALTAARQRGASTVLISCNPSCRPDKKSVDCWVPLATGSEIVAGSTRLAAGTATKVCLNILSSVAFIRLGGVVGDQMLNAATSNEKLRQRAARTLSGRLGISFEEAMAQLATEKWSLRRCLEKKL